MLCLGCAFASCPNVANAASDGGGTTSPLDEDRYRAYVEKIARATKEDIETRVAPQYPPSGETFDALADAAPENIDLCIRYLNESKENERQKRMAIYSMYKLDVDDYVVFIRRLTKLYHSGLVNQWWLSGAIYSRYSLVAVDKYDNPKIQALFKELAAQEEFPPHLKEEIRFIGSGEGFARKRRNDFDRECMSWSQMRSISACVSLATRILKIYAVSWMW
jgi:hypothetical protein